MSGTEFTGEFRRDAGAQVEDRGYPVREVAERFGGQHQIYPRLAKAVLAACEGDPGGRCPSRRDPPFDARTCKGREGIGPDAAGG